MKMVVRFFLVGATIAGFSAPTHAQAQLPDGVVVRDRAVQPEDTGASAPRPTHATASEGLPDATTDAAAVDPTAFVKSAAMGSMTEIELAKIALAKSKDAGIRRFANHMATDHRKSNTELATIARGKGYDVPTSLAAQDENTVKEAAGHSGAQFDAWYASRMVSEHVKAIELFQAAALSPDADLAAFAKKTLPTIEAHQKMAQQIASALPGVSSR